MRKLLLFLLFFPALFSSSSISPAPALLLGETPSATADLASIEDSLFRHSFALFQYLRNPTGVYSDAARFQGAQFHPASVATTGVGLYALCIADSMGWIADAEEQVLHTLSSMAGYHPTFFPERNRLGLFRHFIDQETGERAWNSEFSSIDTGILLAGALFSQRYFSDNDSIKALAEALYCSVDWASVIANPANGGIYLTQDLLGVGGAITLPFNEYIIVAWLAKNDLRENAAATLLWENHYADPAGLPISTFANLDVLTDVPGNFLSGFVHQFPYYMCHPYTIDPAYLALMKTAMQVDSAWWRSQTVEEAYIWGFGAGAANEWVGSGYHADNIYVHPGTICSPHIIAGFLPVSPEKVSDLVEIFQNEPQSRYILPEPDSTEILWRFSTADSSWEAGDVQGIDYVTMLLGLASLPTNLGTAFFSEGNDFDFPALNRENLPPVIQTIPDQEYVEGSSNELFLTRYGTDPDQPFSTTSWVVSGNLQISITIDSMDHSAIISAPLGFLGEEEVVFRLTDMDGAYAEDTVRLRFSLPNGLPVGAGEKGSPAFAYPNPFSESTAITFELLENMAAELVILDPVGREVFRQQRTHLLAGTNQFIWEGTTNAGEKAAAGTYHFVIKTQTHSFFGKLVLNRE